MRLRLALSRITSSDPRSGEILSLFSYGFGLPWLGHFLLDTQEDGVAGFFPGLFLTHLSIIGSKRKLISSILHNFLF
jgi:hypothetical protein